MEDERRRDRLALSDFNNREERQLTRGVRRANLVISGTQLVCGLGLVALGVVASVGVFVVDPPTWIDYTVKAFSVVGLILTVQALRGKGVIGLSHVSEQVGRKLFVRFMRDKGVPEQLAMSRISFEQGRLRLGEEPNVLALENLADETE